MSLFQTCLAGPSCVRILVAGVLLAGPTALAFDSGGFFDRARTVAGCRRVGARGAARRDRRAAAARAARPWLALAGLAGLTAWAAISLVVGAAVRARRATTSAG